MKYLKHIFESSDNNQKKWQQVPREEFYKYKKKELLTQDELDAMNSEAESSQVSLYGYYHPNLKWSEMRFREAACGVHYYKYIVEKDKVRQEVRYKFEKFEDDWWLATIQSDDGFEAYFVCDELEGVLNLMRTFFGKLLIPG